MSTTAIDTANVFEDEATQANKVSQLTKLVTKAMALSDKVPRGYHLELDTQQGIQVLSKKEIKDAVKHYHNKMVRELMNDFKKTKRTTGRKLDISDHKMVYTPVYVNPNFVKLFEDLQIRGLSRAFAGGYMLKNSFNLALWTYCYTFELFDSNDGRLFKLDDNLKSVLIDSAAPFIKERFTEDGVEVIKKVPNDNGINTFEAILEADAFKKPKQPKVSNRAPEEPSSVLIEEGLRTGLFKTYNFQSIITHNSCTQSEALSFVSLGRSEYQEIANNLNSQSQLNMMDADLLLISAERDVAKDNYRTNNPKVKKPVVKKTTAARGNGTRGGRGGARGGATRTTGLRTQSPTRTQQAPTRPPPAVSKLSGTSFQQRQQGQAASPTRMAGSFSTRMGKR